jgi:hypothetical protein
MDARWLKLALLGLAGLCAAACSRAPNPVIAHDPIPPPPPGYKVVCVSAPFIFHGFVAHCQPGERPVIVEERVVVRARG